MSCTSPESHQLREVVRPLQRTSSWNSHTHTHTRTEAHTSPPAVGRPDSSLREAVGSLLRPSASPLLWGTWARSNRSITLRLRAALRHPGGRRGWWGWWGCSGARTDLCSFSSWFSSPGWSSPAPRRPAGAEVSSACRPAALYQVTLWMTDSEVIAWTRFLVVIKWSSSQDSLMISWVFYFICAL